jgi:uncharacterized protein YdaU (DUF1376 family)
VNYYPHHIGDFNNATRHLTRVERAIYREMLELYYDTEAPLPDDVPWIWKKVIANSQTEREIVKMILKEFFDLAGGVYRNKRCDAEIAAYRAKQESAVRAGRASAESRLNRKLTGASTERQRPLNERPTESQPTRTSNQEPEKRAEAARATRLPPGWFPGDVLKAWAEKERPDLDLNRVVAKFRDHWISKPGKDGLKLDWDATFRNWVREERSGNRPPQLLVDL